MRKMWMFVLAAVIISCDESEGRTPTNVTGGNESTPTSETLSKCSTDKLAKISAVKEVEEIRKALVDFRKSLQDNLRNKSTSCLEDERLLKWHNTPPGSGGRDGIFYGDLTEEQLTKFRRL